MGRGMKAGRRPKTASAGSGKGMQKQMQQIAKMQQQMQAMQEELESREFTATAGGGAVKVTANGAKEITSLQISKEVVDPDDVTMLEDLVMAACNEVIRQVEQVSNDEMGKLTGGLNLPGIM